MTQKGFWNLLEDDLTVAIIWFSHAYRYQGSGRVAPVGWDDKPIYMTDAHGISKNLQFAAILGCNLGSQQYEWAKTLNLTKFEDYKKRMIVYDSYIPAMAIEGESRWQRGIDTIRSFLTKESNRFSHLYHYPTWVEMLPNNE